MHAPDIFIFTFFKGFGLELGALLFSFTNKNKNSAMMVWKSSFNDIIVF